MTEAQNLEGKEWLQFSIWKADRAIKSDPPKNLYLKKTDDFKVLPQKKTKIISYLVWLAPASAIFLH